MTARVVIVFLAMVLAACSGPELMRTPNIYVGSTDDAFDEVPQHFRSPEVDVLYVTDRVPDNEEGQPLHYGYERSRSLRYGSGTVVIGENLTWKDLIQNSRVRKRQQSLPLSIGNIEEKGRFLETPLTVVEVDDALVTDPKLISLQQARCEIFLDELKHRLSLTPRKEAFVYIHGYNNTFDYALQVIAQLWHFLGRIGVPILYSWPAGYGGAKGYGYDRESGEFTVFHLKMFLQVLASCPELEKIHLVAHSRGTDVCTSALRELLIAARAAGADPGAELKIGNLIVAAPDLDLEVVSQRTIAEHLFAGVDRLTIYVSKGDKAMRLAGWLFSSIQRLGKVRPDQVPEEVRKQLEMLRNVHFIDAQVASSFFGHSYFYESPAVSSDLILILRDDRDPGIENGRPLQALMVDFWRIDEGYPGYEKAGQ